MADDVGQGRALDLGCLCFGSGASTSVEKENIYLPAGWQPREQAARAAHLALHRRAAPFDDEPRAPCDAKVRRAIEREVEAHAVELEARRALGVRGERYPFEAAYFSRRPSERRAFLREYFLAHPDGDGVVPGFATQYRARCGQP